MKHLRTLRLPTLLAVLALSGCALSHESRFDSGLDVVSGEPVDVVSDRVDVSVDHDARFDGDVVMDADVRDAPDVPDVTVTCDSGFTMCSGQCVDTQTDTRHCGGCAMANDCTMLAGVSPSSVQCMAGRCVLTGACLPGVGDCDNNPANGCETPTNTNTRCGSCNTMCSSPTPQCNDVGDGGVLYACTSNCMAPTPTSCPDGCFNVQTDIHHCGGCTTDCAAGAPANSTATCTNGSCGATCNAPFANCDSNPDCETNSSTDTNHCGNCNTPCVAGTNQFAACGGGMCQYSCAPNFGDCANGTADGCETDLTANVQHCGACATTCTTAPANGAPACINSTCDFTCNTGFAKSNGACVPPQDVCPGATLMNLQPGQHLLVTDTTAGMGADLVGGMGCSGASGNDVVYQIVPPASGNLTVQLTAAAFDGVLYTRSTCATASTQTACADANSAGVQETLTVAVNRAIPVFLVVDANGNGSGPFGLDLFLSGTCGDHVLDAGERCDDGNANNGDGCDNTCTMPVAITDVCNVTSPATVIITPGQQIYTGTLISGGTDANQCNGMSGGKEQVYRVIPSVTGTLHVDYDPTGAWDAVLYTASDCMTSGVPCVDNVGNDRAESTSIAVTMGQSVEVFADSVGGADRGPFTLTLNLAVCGDSAIESGEECDDGNMNNNDGCSSTCQIEAGCRITETGGSLPATPQAIPAMCHTALVSGSLTTMLESDYYSLVIPPDQRVRIQTFNGSVGTVCTGMYDPVMEVYETSAGVPTNTNCAGSTALACQDDANGAMNQCQDFSFVTPAMDTYVFRIFAANASAPAANYKILIQR